MRPFRTTAFPAAFALVAALALVGCSDSKKDDESAFTTTTTAAITAGGSSTTGSTTAVTALTGAGVTPVSTPVGGQALLSAVRTSTNPGFDRVVFEFEGGDPPGYAVQYVARPVHEDGSGNTVNVQGAQVLEVRMEHASGADLSGGKFRQTYTGPKQIPVNGPAVVEVVRSGDFEGVMHWVIGTTGKLPFKVQALTNPTRVVVDIAQSGG